MASKTLMALMVIAVFSTACVEDVEYTVTCDRVACPNADDTSEFVGTAGQSFTCTWLCANYQGNKRVYVSLTFWSWDGGCWELTSEYISDGICN